MLNMTLLNSSPSIPGRVVKRKKKEVAPRKIRLKNLAMITRRKEKSQSHLYLLSRSQTKKNLK